MRLFPMLLAAMALALVSAPASAQSLTYSRGQTVSPAYEGFEMNPDGSYSLVFGYMNRNWEEELDVPVGPDNYFSFTPAGGLDDLGRDAYDAGIADQGQPTHFLPRRNRFTFKVRVPADFGDQELVWTLRSQGETKRAFASLRQDLLVDNMVIASETGALGAGRSDPETRSNVAPVIEIESDRVVDARVGQAVTLVAKVTDDGLPITTAQRRARALAQRAAGSQSDSATANDAAAAAGNQDEEEEDEPELSPELRSLQRALNEPGRVTVNKSLGLHFAWFVYRGENSATFDRIQIKTWEDSRAWMNSPWSPYWEAPPVPEDGRWVVRVTFDRPGTYVLRGRADDGALYADQEVTINVAPLVN
ncbi:MAG TPA: hypothetical protein VM198_01765 [Longimicrobiales bacterium]|nr:hypothetical protein [Longimicrobiales bacterium]